MSSDFEALERILRETGQAHVLEPDTVPAEVVDAELELIIVVLPSDRLRLEFAVAFAEIAAELADRLKRVRAVLAITRELIHR